MAKEKRKLTSVSVYEKRSGQGSEGWPMCLTFNFNKDWPIDIVLQCKNDAHEAQEIADVIGELIYENECLKEKQKNG